MSGRARIVVAAMIVLSGCSQPPPDPDRTVITMTSVDGYVPEAWYRKYVISAQRHIVHILVVTTGEDEIARDQKPLPDEIWNALITSVPSLEDADSRSCLDAGISNIVVTERRTVVKQVVEWCPGERRNQMRKTFFEPVEALFDMPRLLNRPAD